MADLLPPDPPALPEETTEETTEKPEAPLEPEEGLTPEQFFGKLLVKFQATGELTKEDLTTLATTHGLTEREAQAEYLLHRESRNAALGSLKDLAGGPQAWDALLEFAAKDRSLSAEDRGRINTLLTHPDEAVRKTAVEELKLRYRQSGSMRPRAAARPAAPKPVEPFTSSREIAAAMRDPRMETDNQYRTKVYARLAVTEGYVK